MSDRKLFKCFDLRFLLLVLAMALLVIAAAWVGRRFEHGSPGRFAAAAVQALAMGFVIVQTVISLRRLDELQYRIHLEAIAWAFAATAVLLTSWGFLQRAGLPAVEWGLWAWPLMVGLWGSGLMILRRRYQ